MLRWAVILVVAVAAPRVEADPVWRRPSTPRPRPRDVARAPTHHAPAIPATADELVRRYRAVGEALRLRSDAEDLRARYRAINLVEALRDAERRTAALAALDAIARALHGS